MPVVVGRNDSLTVYPHHFTQNSQATWIMEGKRLKQNRVHHAENGGNGADAQSYGQEGGKVNPGDLCKERMLIRRFRSKACMESPFVH